MDNLKNFSRQKDVISSTGSGYTGVGFRYLPHEWPEKIRELMGEGMTEADAVIELTKREEAAREGQQRAA